MNENDKHTNDNLHKNDNDKHTNVIHHLLQLHLFHSKSHVIMKHLQSSFVNLPFLRLQNMSMFSVACLLLLVQPLDAGKSPSCSQGHCKPKPPTLLQIRAKEVGNRSHTLPWDERLKIYFSRDPNTSWCFR